jgi:hypothetical protein
MRRPASISPPAACTAGEPAAPPPDEGLIADGELLAYLDGHTLCRVRRALRHSPELRARLRHLALIVEQLERRFAEP